MSEKIPLHPRKAIPLQCGPLVAKVTPLALDVVAWWLTCAPPEVEALREYLSPDECARADRFLFPRARDHFVVGRGRLRQVLGGLCGCPPAAVRFAVAERGKPRLVDRNGRLRFNVAHSHDLMLCALTLDHEVGVDVERVRPDFDYADLARRFFAEGEVQALGRVPPALAQEAFFACWTRKEAVIKATGEGMARSLGSFAVTVDPARAALLSADASLGPPAEWSLLPVAVPSGYQGTVAVRAHVALRMTWFPEGTQ